MIYKNIGDMKDNYVSMRDEAFDDYNKNVKDNKKRILKIFLLILVPLIIFVLVVKIFFTEINIFLPFQYRGARLYKVYVNDEHISAGYESVKRYPIIPYTFNLAVSDFGVYYNSKNNMTDLKVNLGDEVKIDVKSYECYSSADNEAQIKLKCDSKSRNLKEVKSNYGLEVIKMNKNNVYKYKGDFINYIGEYFDEKGHYIVYITDRHGLTKTQVYFYIDVIDVDN